MIVHSPFALLCRVAVLAVLVSSSADTAELKEIVVEMEGGRYRLTSKTYFDATPAQLYRVLTDYTQFTHFSSAFVESGNREPDELGRPQFYTRMEGCVLLYCRSYIRYGYLELKPDQDIIAVGDPELSNFDYSRERWQLISKGEGTLMIYDFEMEPGFWVPPIVGPYVIKRALRNGGGDAVDRIEALALGQDPKK